MAGEYKVDPEALKRVERGIKGAIDELSELTFDVNAQMGNGFDELKLSGMELGHKALTEGFEDFCERWGWGVRFLIGDANDLAMGLGLSAGLYHEQEEYVSGALKETWTAAAGNPYMSPEEAQKRSWSETLKDNPASNLADPDYSAESYIRHSSEGMAAWDQTGEDFKSSPWQDLTGMESARERSDWQWEGPPQAQEGGERSEQGEQEDGGR